MFNPTSRRRSAAAYRFLPLGFLVIASVLFLALGGHRYLTLAALAEHRQWLCDRVARGGIGAVVLFILAYTALVALSVPGCIFMTLTSGFLFGPWLGAVYAVIAGTVGATIVFLAAHTGLAGLTGLAGPWARRIETGFRQHGLNYLLVLRLVPIFPFWLVNLAAAAFGLPLWIYVFGTLVGIAPGAFIFASIGTSIGKLLDDGRGIDFQTLFHPDIFLPLAGLAALILAPVLYKTWRERSSARRETA